MSAPGITLSPERLDAFLRPRSLAVVGAGERPTSSGGAVLRNIDAARWPGRVIPVNPKGGVILGRPAARSLREVSPPADLVAILVKPESILDVVREAVETGHRQLLILPGGFTEAGESGRQRALELDALAREHDLLIGGPNCAGTINLLDAGNPFAATFFRDMPRGGPVAFVSQSGAIVEELVSASHEMRIPLGAVVSIGNAMHLDLTAYLEALGRDPDCGVVLLYAESFGDTERFRAVAREVSRRKPVVALIGGRTPPGRDAAHRHTGSVAMTDEAAEAFCRDCGILRVRSLRELKLAAKVLAMYPEGAGPRILVLSNSGGPGVLTTDAATVAGLQVASLPNSFAAPLRSALPAEAAVANPMDLLADAREDRFALCFEAALAHVPSAFDQILMLHVVPFMVDAAPVVAQLAALKAGRAVPVMHAMMGTLGDRDGWFGTLEAAGIPAFGDGEDMACAAACLARLADLKAHRVEA
jgi:acetyltransferase